MFALGLSDAGVLALIVGIFAFINRWIDRKDKREDWKRQDDVARQAAEAATLLKKFQRESEVRGNIAADDLNEVKKIAKTTHALVNSNMTAALTAQLESKIETLASLHEILDLKRAAGTEPSSRVLAVIAATEAKISELTAVLNDRAKADPKK